MHLIIRREKKCQDIFNKYIPKEENEVTDQSKKNFQTPLLQMLYKLAKQINSNIAPDTISKRKKKKKKTRKRMGRDFCMFRLSP